MSKELVLKTVEEQKPRLIYLSGKTCTGKTTFSNELEQQGYTKIELDKIVMRSVVTPFNVNPGDGFRTAYRGLGPKEQIDEFVKATKEEITKRVQETSLVIEGAIATPEILSAVFSGDLTDFTFIYFHPVNIDVYEGRILSRFIAGAKDGSSGLPKDFWSLVKDSDLDEFKSTDHVNSGIKNAINEYAIKSMNESQIRLAGFKTYFPNIIVIEI
ncbi:MAG: hypothetical protein WCF94_02295 [bacterium]